NHTGDSDTPTDGRLIPDYTQLGFRVPTIVVSNLAPCRVVNHGPFEHTSTLKLIERTFGLNSLTARDRNALDLGLVLERRARRPVPAGAIPTSAEVPGPANDAAAVCSASSVQSVSPQPVRRGKPRLPYAPVIATSGTPSGAGMVAFGQQMRSQESK